MPNRRKVAAAAVVLVLAFTGCGKAAEKLAEKATGCKNIDVNNKGANAECNGVNVSTSGDGKVPDGFPKELAPPKGARIYYSLADKTSEGKPEWNVSASIARTRSWASSPVSCSRHGRTTVSSVSHFLWNRLR